MSAIDLKITNLKVLVAFVLQTEIRETAESLSKKHGKSVNFYLELLKENPFEGFGNLVAAELNKSKKHASCC